ncbi:helix-turn-helix domain-containing protein [Methylocystis iwaonis]|nr:helix-turn-helix domain-containing protein [Methylocystis iwaonis]
MAAEGRHGWTISCRSDAGAKSAACATGVVARPRRGGPGSGDFADPGRLDERAHRRGFWRSRRIVRDWRSTFMREGVDGLASRRAAGRPPIKAMAALSVADEILSAPVADRPNWTLPRLSSEIERRTGVTISKSRLSVVLRKKGV